MNPYHYTKVEQQVAYVLVPKSIQNLGGVDSISQYPLDELSNTVPHNIQYSALTYALSVMLPESKNIFIP